MRSLKDGLAKFAKAGTLRRAMPLIKLNRIHKGGELVLNSDHIQFIEVESKVTTIHLTGNLLFSVEEAPDSIAQKIEAIEAVRGRNAASPAGPAGA